MSDIQALKDRIEELEELLGMRLPTPRLGVLTKVRKTPLKVLGLLLKRGLITREFAYSALYGGRPESEQPTDPRVIDQHVCSINRVLRPHGVTIRTEFGIGYYLDPQSQEVLKELMRDGQCGDGQASSTTQLHS